MKTEKEIQKLIKYIKSLYKVDMYEQGRYDALQWVLEGTSGIETNQKYEIKWQKLKKEIKRQLFLCCAESDVREYYGKIFAYHSIREFMHMLDCGCQLIDENQPPIIQKPEKNLTEKELEAEIEVFTNLHDAFININNSLIRHGHTDIFKEYLFDDAISALTKAVIVKENKLREIRAKE